MIYFKKCEEGILWNFGGYWGTSLIKAIQYYIKQKR